jgi:hypothetical protein
MLVSAGTITIAELTNGTLISRGMDVFQATWLTELFATVGGIDPDAPMEERRPRAPSVTIDARFGAVLACHILRRVFATVRGAQHGGMLIIVPERGSNEVLSDGRHIRVKYSFVDEEPRRRLRTLTAEILNELTAAHRGPSCESPIPVAQGRPSRVDLVCHPKPAWPTPPDSTAEILNAPFPESSTNVPNGTYVCIATCQDAVSYQRRHTMPESDVSRGARRKRSPVGRAEFLSALEGQIEEICRDLAVQVKRMRQVQEQADELRTTLREWAGPAGADSRVRTD